MSCDLLPFTRQIARGLGQIFQVKIILAVVNAPVFTNFPMTMECRIKQKFDESETGYYLVAEVVNVLCDEKYLDGNGNPDVEKMNLITYDSVNHNYIQLGKTLGKAFACGKEI